MDDYYRRSHVPAFGSWNFDDDLPFTSCFESARQAGFLHCTYPEDRDLYVAGDLYENDVTTPAMIVVPRRRVKPAANKEKAAWVICDCECDCDLKRTSAPVPPPKLRRAPKAIDEDLYEISPELLLRSKPKRKVWGIFGSCFKTSVR